MTTIWVAYTAYIFWVVPDWRLSLFGLFLISGVAASAGIWLGIRFCGYLFAGVNLVGACLSVMLMLGYFLPDRPLTLKTLTLIAVPLFCAYASICWARIKPEPQSDAMQ